jgi:hypothetical protein
VNQAKAIADIIAYIKEIRTRPETGITGFTYSSMSPSVFRGVWCDEGGNRITDNIVLCYLGFNSSGAQELTSWQEIAALKNAVREAYAKYGSHQDEIWLVSHQVRRQLGPELDSDNNPVS